MKQNKLKKQRRKMMVQMGRNDKGIINQYIKLIFEFINE